MEWIPLNFRPMTLTIADWEFRTITHEGHLVAVRLRDPGPGATPVILLPGILTTADTWPLILSDVAFPRRSASVSLPGHAPSQVPGGFTTADVRPELFSGIVRAAAEQLFPGERVHLIGWSTGGFAALMTAADAPELVKSVVCVSGFARGRWGSLFGLMQWIGSIPGGGWGFRLGLQELCRFRITLRLVLRCFAASHDPGDDVSRAMFEMLRDALMQHDRRVILELFRGLRRIDATDRLPRIAAPVLVIGGDSDPVVVPAESQHLHAAIPHSDLHLRAKTGHLFYREHRAEVLARINRYLQQHD